MKPFNKDMPNPFLVKKNIFIQSEDKQQSNPGKQ